jgi:hypothetical protein
MRDAMYVQDILDLAIYAQSARDNGGHGGEWEPFDIFPSYSERDDWTVAEAENSNDW